ncbi:FAD-dependent oxidoreductase [candidate division KSB1 bacterium]|nr:FAD-dependent oxidoreductase [candidate division KSB1 bacterium]
MELHPGYFVAIFGGACAGSEAAHQLAQRGIYSVVIEKNPLPYGKIEDGLPKWHVKLRNKEEKKIDDKINQQYVSYVPNMKLGETIDFDEIVNNWGFSAVLLATGAWKDRPMTVPGIDDYIGKGFYYQNPFVDWFNHYHESDYDRELYEIHDDAVVIGGGLASIDVVKILMLESTLRVLEKRGLESDLFSLDKKGIPKILDGLGLQFEDLELKGCTLYYRRRDIDMPLASPPENATPEQLQKTQMVRQKILQNAQRKYCFRFQPCSVPVDKIVDGDRLVGLVFQKSEIIDGKVKLIPGSTFEVRSPLVISSIGSIPESTNKIPMKGELFIIDNENTGKMEGYENVFALGNAVTGRGNIKESEVHGRIVVNHVMNDFLKWTHEDYTSLVNGDGGALNNQNRNLLTEEQIKSIQSRVVDLQKKVEYHGDYEKWVQEHKYERLEDILGIEA